MSSGCRRPVSSNPVCHPGRAPFGVLLLLLVTIIGCTSPENGAGAGGTLRWGPCIASRLDALKIPLVNEVGGNAGELTVRYFETGVIDRTASEADAEDVRFDIVYGNYTDYFWRGELPSRRPRRFERDGLVGLSVDDRDRGTRAWYVLCDSVVYGVELVVRNERMAVAELKKILEYDGPLAHAYVLRPHVEQLHDGDWSRLTARQALISILFNQAPAETTELRLWADLLEVTFDRSGAVVTRAQAGDSCLGVRVAKPVDGFWPAILRCAPPFFTEFVADTMAVGEPMVIEAGVMGISHTFSLDLWPVCGRAMNTIRQSVVLERPGLQPGAWDECRSQ